MAQSTARAVVSVALSPAEIRGLLYKEDHPRAIDRFVDFFGDGAQALDSCDRCGELLLEALA